MSNISYGGISMRINQIQQDVNAVYTPDGADYLYTHIRTTVACVWNPSATSDSGAVAATSIANLRATLMTPRLPLIISVPSGGSGGSSLLLRSPLLRPSGTVLPCDANNGPKPVGEPIIKLVGETSALVQFTVETWVVEVSSTLRPILSHRWQMEEEVDVDLYTTRTITGEAYFNAAWMEYGPTRVNADDFRTYLFHPIPDQFKRTIRVRQSSDNTKLNYMLTDKQIASRIDGTLYPNITQAYGWFTRDASQASMSAMAEAAAGLLNPLTAFGAIRSILFDGVCFPSITLSMEVHIHGSSVATMADLSNAMEAVFLNFRFRGEFLFGLNVSSFFNGSTLTYSMGLERKLIGRATGKFALGSIIMQDLFGVGPGGIILDNYDLTDVTPVTTRVIGAAGGNPTSGSYGTTIERMVAQVLATPGATPSAVPTSSPNPPVAWRP
jgi:hypothetical protein